MPTMGRPSRIDADNPYRKVQKYEGPHSNFNQLREMDREKNKGEYLNNLTGKKGVLGEGNVKVVDGTKHGKLGKDGFLRLLMHQLSNQNPLKPVDQNKMAADLAQFSQLEQMSNMNKNLEKVLADDVVKKKFFAASFLGKKVMTKGSSIQYHGEGTATPVRFEIPQDIAKGILRIYDQRKQMIAQIDLGARLAGLHSIAWDGKQLDGLDAGKGNYTFQIKAWDQLNNEIKAETKAEGLVTGVSFDGNGKPMVTVDNKAVYLRDIQSFQLAQSGSQNGQQGSK